MFGWLRSRIFSGRTFFSHHRCQSRGHYGGGWGEPNAERAHAFLHRAVGYAAGRIGADDTQRGAAEVIAESAWSTLLPIRQRARELRGKLKDALERGADPAELEALRAEGVAVADEGSRVAFSHLQQVRALLNEEQWQKLVAMSPMGRRRSW